MSDNNDLIKIVESNAKSIAALSDTVAEQGRQVAEQGRQLAEQGRQIAEQGRQIAEQGRLLAEQGRHLERTIKTVERLADLQIQFVQTTQSRLDSLQAAIERMERVLDYLIRRDRPES